MNKLLKQAKAVIFDVDGLLIDSESLWDRARNVFAQKYGKSFSESIHMRMRGMGMKEVLTVMKDELKIDGDLDTLIKQFRTTFYELALEQKQLSLMPGAQDIISSLFQDKKILAIATGGHAKEKMEEILHLLSLNGYFSVVVSSDQVKKGKPAPDIFLFTAEELQIPKEECVILEDAANGVEAAKRAGMKVIAVQKDEEMRKKLTSLVPDILVEGLEELI